MDTLDPYAWSFRAGSLFGVRIRIHYLFPLFLLPMILQVGMRDNTPRGTLVDAFCLGAVYALLVLFHELGHSLFARRVGGEADDILLWPLGGLARANYLPNSPRAHFWFVFGGPLSDLICFVASTAVLAFAFAVPVRPAFNPFVWYPFRIADGAYDVPTWTGETHTVTSIFAMLVMWINLVSWINLLINVCLVGLPLDGGQMGRALLWPRVGRRNATKYMITSAFAIAIALVAVSIFTSVTAVFVIGVYVFWMCRHEWLMLAREDEDSLFGYDFSQGYTSLERDDGEGPAPPATKQGFFERWKRERKERREKREQEQRIADERRMDELLEKIQRSGKDSLTGEEQRFMKRVAEQYRNRK